MILLTLIGGFWLLPQPSSAPQSPGWGTDHLRRGRDQQKRQPSKNLCASWVLHQSVAMATSTTGPAVCAYTHVTDNCCLPVVRLAMEMAATPSEDFSFFCAAMYCLMSPLLLLCAFILFSLLISVRPSRKQAYFTSLFLCIYSNTDLKMSFFVRGTKSF